MTMRTNPRLVKNRAITRFEVLVVAGVIALLAAVVLPGVANTATRYNRLLCLNNLRQIGVAFRAWGNDHGDFVPLRTPMKYGGLGRNPGGAVAYARAGEAWYDLAHLSNQLGSPMILTCPGDTLKVPNQVSTWADLFQSKNSSISYAVSPEVHPSQPQSVVSMDRNIQASGLGNCSIGITGIGAGYLNVATAELDPHVGWTNALHYPMGNLLLNDGRVVEAAQDRLAWFLGRVNAIDGNGSFHFVMP